MAGTAVKRVNFLERGKNVVTYETMLKVFVGWCAFLMILYGLQFVRQAYLKHEIKMAGEDMVRMEEYRDYHLKQMQKVSLKRFDTSAKAGLSEIVRARPHWSRALVVLAGALPAQVWLDLISVDKPKDPNSAYQMGIHGKAKSQRELTNFLMRLESGKAFGGSALVSSELIGGKTKIYEFEITTNPLTVGP